ncbi:MAG: HIT family protein [Blastochloris sp.]|nr:HIT family protein [Blastochloris sp.]
MDAKIPGYLMLSPVSGGSEFHDLSEAALTELGPILSKATKGIQVCFKPDYIFTSRYGVTPGFALHFHIIPIYSWIKDMLKEHPRYRYLDSLYNPDFGTTPDAADFTLFIWREFIESKTPLAAAGFSFDDIVTTLRYEITKKANHAVQPTPTRVTSPALASLAGRSRATGRGG